jgi:hypothetical protein
LLAYLIIAIELVILYTVFWYVFLREPRPYKIKGNPWGGYTGDGHTGGVYHGGSYPGIPYPGAQASEAARTGSSTYIDEKSQEARQAIYEEWNVAERRIHTVGELMRSQTGGVERLTTSGEDGACQATFPIENNIFTASSKYLQELGDKLNRINIKLP